jgi:membrane protein required for colicin V production
MNWLDLVVIVMLIGFTLAAYTAGLIREFITLVAAIAGLIIAGMFYDDLATDVLAFEHNAEAAEGIAFLILFGSVYLLGQIGAYLLKTGAALLMLGPIDHAGGAVFGLVKGLIVVQVILLILAAYPSLGLDEAVDNSQVARLFVDDWSFLRGVLPSNIEARVDQFLSPQSPPQ